jgi:hypothetical protein
LTTFLGCIASFIGDIGQHKGGDGLWSKFKVPLEFKRFVTDVSFPKGQVMNESLNTLEMIDVCAESVSSQIVEELPSQLLASIMEKDYRILMAAIIEHGGEMLVSSESVYKAMNSTRHVAAVAEEDGSIKLMLASTEEITRATSELVLL